MTHGTPMDMSNTTKINLALLALHDRLKARNAPKADAVRRLPKEASRAYYTAKRAESRARAKAEADAGRPAAHKATVRDALADAALMILATNGPGADQVRHVLAAVFVERPGVPSMVERKARTGRLRPKLARGA